MQLTAMASTDETALNLLRELKNATTDEEKEKAKENGKAYIEAQKPTEEVPTAHPTFLIKF